MPDHQIVKPRRNWGANRVPLSSDLVDNEIAINFADNILYAKNPANGNIVSITLGGSGGGGGSANIVQAATVSGFPATGSAGTLYHATNSSRIFFWDSSGVYVEVGTSGGGGSGDGTDSVLRALFVPGAPTSVTATAGNTQATVSWTAPTGVISQAPITDYVVQFSSNSGSTWSTFSDGTSTATSATVTGLTNDTAYTFRVAASNSIGTGAYSTASSAVTPNSFTASAVILTSGSSYTVPSGATSMKAWAVGGGGPGGAWSNSAAGAGGCAYKTWTVAGATVAYSAGAAGSNSTITYSGTTITGNGCTSGLGLTGGSFSGGDGGAQGGAGESFGDGDASGGAVGGNGTKQSCGRKIATDVSGLLAAVALAGGKATEDCGATAAFGSGSATGKYRPGKTAGYGGGGANPNYGATAGAGAVVLYFT
jgi:hypothetical protein